MSQNDRILLDQLLEQRKVDLAPELTKSEFFELYVSEQTLKDYDLSYEEIQQGIVDGGGDGGIDSIYIFLNGNLITEDIDSKEVKRGASIELHFIQAKDANGFEEAALDRFRSSTRDLLDLSTNLDDLESVYKNDLIERVSVFRETWLALASKVPNLSIKYGYATRGTEVHPNTERKIKQLRETVESLFTPVTFEFSFYKAPDLLALARRSPATTYSLKLAETPIVTGDQGYVCLVSLSEFCQFISEEDGVLKERVFEGNVRDYQGDTEVNVSIRDSLRAATGEDFWWLNNGLSIICSSATLSAKTLTIENPEIVNGLQTSREIHNVFSQKTEEIDSRNVLIRVLVTEERESRDRIIRATNSQTRIPIASLRATDDIHRNIEDYLFKKGLFYDRRKNYYKNMGKPVKKILSISTLAQYFLAFALRDPGNARARPSSLLKRDDDYKNIFNHANPISLYHVCVVLGRKIDDILRSPSCTVEKHHWNNIRYYALMLVGLRATNDPAPSMSKLSIVNPSSLPEELILACINDAYQTYTNLGGDDQIAKGTELTDTILTEHRHKVAEYHKANTQKSSLSGPETSEEEFGSLPNS